MDLDKFLSFFFQCDLEELGCINFIGTNLFVFVSFPPFFSRISLQANAL